jgi:hypothetical protein
MCLNFSSILVDSGKLQFHPGLLIQNMPFTAGPGGQGHVKKSTLPFYIFRFAPKIRLFPAGCTQ